MLLNPDAGRDLAKEAAAMDPAATWAAAGDAALPGRGTLRRVALAGRALLLKREARGGFAAPVLPDRYLSSSTFRREWALTLWLGERGLTPAPAARWLVRRGRLYEVYTLLEPLPGVRSLAERLAEGICGPEAMTAAGECVGRLHGLGVCHADLNAGNLLLGADGRAWAIDFRHSTRAPVLGEGRRIANLRRLERSLVKLSAHAPSPPSREAWRALAAGYARGFGRQETAVDRWADRAGSGFLLRKLGWAAREKIRRETRGSGGASSG